MIKLGRPREKQNAQRLALYLESDVILMLDNLAEQNHTSRSDIVEQLVRGRFEKMRLAGKISPEKMRLIKATNPTYGASRDGKVQYEAEKSNLDKSSSEQGAAKKFSENYDKKHRKP